MDIKRKIKTFRIYKGVKFKKWLESYFCTKIEKRISLVFYINPSRWRPSLLIHLSPRFFNYLQAETWKPTNKVMTQPSKTKRWPLPFQSHLLKELRFPQLKLQILNKNLCAKKTFARMNTHLLFSKIQATKHCWPKKSLRSIDSWPDRRSSWSQGNQLVNSVEMNFFFWSAATQPLIFEDGSDCKGYSSEHPHEAPYRPGETGNSSSFLLGDKPILLRALIWDCRL